MGAAFAGPAVSGRGRSTACSVAERKAGHRPWAVAPPHAGDPAGATLGFLHLSQSIGTDHADQTDPHFRRDCLDLLVFRTNPPFLHVADRYVDENGLGTTADAQLWRPRLRDLADAVGGYEPLGRSLLCLEFFAYHCPTYRPLPGVLPS